MNLIVIRQEHEAGLYLLFQRGDDLFFRVDREGVPTTLQQPSVIPWVRVLRSFQPF
jgi:hypothetical protein